MCFIPDWRRAWRFLSVQLAAILAALSVVQAGLLDLQPLLPPRLFSVVAALLSVAIVVGRVIRQFQAAPVAVEGDHAERL